MHTSVLRNLKTSAAVAAGALTLSVLVAAPAVADSEPMDQNTSSASVADKGDEKGKDSKEDRNDKGREDGKEDKGGEGRYQHHYGKVVAKTGVNVRKHATTKSRIVGGHHHGAIIKIKCKVKGENILGNDRWYKLAYHDGWVTARWVKNLDHIPWCNYHGR